MIKFKAILILQKKKNSGLELNSPATTTTKKNENNNSNKIQKNKCWKVHHHHHHPVPCTALFIIIIIEKFQIIHYLSSSSSSSSYMDHRDSCAQVSTDTVGFRSKKSLSVSLVSVCKYSKIHRDLFQFIHFFHLFYSIHTHIYCTNNAIIMMTRLNDDGMMMMMVEWEGETKFSKI